MKFFKPRVAKAETIPPRDSAVGDPVHVRMVDIHKSYGDHHVLKGVSVNLHRRKTNIVIGPSGSGKTVLMRQLIRLERPDSGKLLVDGRDFAQLGGVQLEAMRRTFGMVFQMSALFDSMTVFDNVAFPLREHTTLGRKEVREQVMARLETLGIDAAEKKSPAELSGGMQKRVAVARAMILESEILIYDEPTTGLDPMTTQTVDELITEAEEKFGVTSVVISHDMASVFRIADYINFLNFGEVLATGTRADFVSSTDPIVSNFIRASGVQIS